MSRKVKAPAPRKGGRGLGARLAVSPRTVTTASRNGNGYARRWRHSRSKEVGAAPLPDMVDALATFIGAFRREGGMSREMMEAALAYFPSASTDDYESALGEAIRRERDVLRGKR